MANDLDPETELSIERLFVDARSQAANPNPLYKGRNLEDIDDDIELVRNTLDMEL